MKVNGVTIRRSYFETPTMDDRKWAKIPEIPADVFYADMEDSVPPSLKEKAREKVVELIKNPEHFGGREFICRTNNLNSPWGREDLEAMAEAHAPFVLYPKVRDTDEMHEVMEILHRHGATPEVMLIIETPQAILHLEEIASVPGVAGLAFGPGDFALETGVSLLDGDESFTDGMLYARTKTHVVARALQLESVEGMFLANLKDLETVRRLAHRSRLFGFSGVMVFYPSHVPIINESRTPRPEEVAWSQRVVEAFEEARARGQGAITLDGRWLTVHQFTAAQQDLAIAKALGLTG